MAERPIYLPAHTHCSECGQYAGDDLLGVAFSTLREAEEYLRQNPNPGKRWGDGERVVTVVLR